MRLTRVLLLGPVLLALLFPGAALAAEQKPDSVLTQLYLAQIRAPKPDPYLDKRIVTERARVRADEAKEIDVMVKAADAESPDAVAAGTVTSPLQKQQALVDGLLTRRQETRVDRDLLLEEENTLEENMPSLQGTALQGAQRRKAEQLSSQAVLEERMGAIDDALGPQQDRLQRLSAQQRTAQFVDFVQFGLYAGVLVLIVVAERLIRRTIISRIPDRNRRYLAMKVFTGVTYVIIIGWTLYRISLDYPGIVTSFAIVGAGIAVALQGVIKDVVGWILIVQKRLFTLGQRVTIGPYTGDVADISLLRTTIVEFHNTSAHDPGRGGQTLYIPNSMVLDQPVLNFHASSDFMEAEIPVTVMHGSDWKKAEEILRKILDEEVGEFVERARRQYAHRTMHFFAAQEPPGPRVFTDLSLKGVLFLLRFQIPIGQRRNIVTRITQKILERFAANDPPIVLARD